MGDQSDPGFTALLASLAPDPLTRGKQFERLTKWWLTQNPIWSRKIKTVWLWDEWPNYPGRDIGIDLVAEMTDGSLCAIQAKCFDENRVIPKSELDSFISAASPRTFKHRLLVATTDGLSANAKRMLADQHVVRVMRSDLESSLDEWPASIDQLMAKPHQHASPRPHQTQAIQDITTGLQTHSRGQLIMACGTGKTLTALWIKETLKPKTTLLLVPSLNLLAQTLSEWAKNANNKWSYLCVCSDETVNKSDDQPISTIDELPFEVTTKPAAIAEFLSLDGEKIIFSTYQSSAQVAKAQKQVGTQFDLVICDEAHRLTGKTDADYATVLNEKKIVGEKLLFMTATPRTYTPAAKTKAEDRGVEITSMDDEHIYGPVLHKLSFGEAIKQDLLSDYRVLIVGVTDPQVQDLIDRRELVSVNDTVTTDARTLAAHIGLAKATKDYNLKRTISFHSRIKSADQFAKDHIKILDWLPDTHKPSGETWTGTISGAMNTGERRRLLTQLRQDDNNRHALLTNARCLTEGVDVPSLDGVAFIDPRSSQVDIIQAVGRAIRKSENKEIGTIVLPVLIPTDSDAEQALEDTAFKPIWEILNALKSHDEELSSKLNILRTELGRTGEAGPIPERIVQDLPADIDALLPEFSSRLSVAILEHSTSSWELWFGLLENYQLENGHCLVPHNYLSGHYKLGQWVTSQRSKFKSGLLTEEKIVRLEALVGWSWDALDTQWNEAYEALVAYRDTHGHIEVKKGEVQNGIKLRIWISVQRRNYPARMLRSEYVRRLEILPGWSWNPYVDQWNTQLEHLKGFAEANGHCSIPRRSAEWESLAIWAATQRLQFRNALLRVEQISKLELVKGWEWDPRVDGFSKLEDFWKQFGHVNVPTNYAVEDFSLGRWCTRKRYEFRTATISDQDIKRLVNFEGWSWDPEKDEWERKIALLREYAETHLSASPPKGHTKDGVNLYKFARYLRSRFDTLSDDRKKQVLGIPCWLKNVFDGQFELNLNALMDFTKQFPGTLPATATVHILEGKKFTLGTWVAGRRQAFRKGTLTVVHREALEKVPSWTWNPVDESKDQMFRALLSFVSREGHANVPSDRFETIDQNEVSLGTWVTNRRMQFRKGKLDPEVIDQLNKVPGWTWDPISDKFEIGFSMLEEFVKVNGTSQVPTNTQVQLANGQGFKLGSWCSVRRQEHLRGVIDTDKKTRLEALPGWTWDPKDAEWMSFYSSVLEHAKQTGSPPKRGHLDTSELKTGSWCDSTRSYYKKGTLRADRILLMESIPNWTWNPHDDAWVRMKDLLIDFYETHDAEIPAKYIYKGKQLGGWVSKQRAAFKDGSRQESRIVTLEKIDKWTWEPFKSSSTGIRSDALLTGDSKNSEIDSQNWLHLLTNFIEAEGHADVPATYSVERMKLGRWVQKTRSRYKKHTLPSQITQRLEAIPEWRWDPMKARWDDRIDQLRQFSLSNNHISLSREIEDQKQLESWVVIQRIQYRKGKLSSEQIKNLESIPEWSWAPLQETWESSSKYLLDYVKRTGHSNVPQHHYEGSFPLGAWVNKRRSAFKRGAMKEAERLQLEQVAGWLWSPTTARKELGFESLLEFINREGHARVPAKHLEQGFALGQWVVSRRQTFKHGKMIQSEQERLENITGWEWTPRKIVK